MQRFLPIKKCPRLCLRIFFTCQRRRLYLYLSGEIGSGQHPRQPGQVREEAAVTGLCWVIRQSPQYTRYVMGHRGDTTCQTLLP